MGTNHHYVPRYFFRRFSLQDRMIALIRRASGHIVEQASIATQSAKNNFYGSQQVESALAQIENTHAVATDAWHHYAWGDFDFTPPEEFRTLLLQCILFQRARTSLEVAKHIDAQKTIVTQSFRHYLANAPGIDRRDEMLKHIDAGHFHLTKKESAAALENIRLAFDSTELLSDLSLCLLRNRTDYPFIFSDSPVIFYNDYCWNVKNRGVLGYTCSGLQIIYPIDMDTCVLLYDPKKYEGPATKSPVYDVWQRGDISQLNALQLHHSEHAIYFGDRGDRDYITDLWNAHRRRLIVPRSAVDLDSPLLVDGVKPPGKLMQVFEPQLNYEMSLSFISSQRVRETDYVFQPRSPELRNKVRRREERHLRDRH